jgi:hypothetical protein
MAEACEGAWANIGELPEATEISGLAQVVFDATHDHRKVSFADFRNYYADRKALAGS